MAEISGPARSLMYLIFCDRTLKLCANEAPFGKSGHSRYIASEPLCL